MMMDDSSEKMKGHVFPRKFVGWAIDTKMMEQLVISAFKQAYGKEHPYVGLAVHTDQGSQFTCGRFACLSIALVHEKDLS